MLRIEKLKRVWNKIEAFKGLIQHKEWLWNLILEHIWASEIGFRVLGKHWEGLSIHGAIVGGTLSVDFLLGRHVRNLLLSFQFFLKLHLASLILLIDFGHLSLKGICEFLNICCFFLGRKCSSLLEISYYNVKRMWLERLRGWTTTFDHRFSIRHGKIVWRIWTEALILGKCSHGPGC